MSTNLLISDQIGTSVVDYSGLVNMALFSSDVQSQITDRFFNVSYNFSPCSVTTNINDIQSVYNTTSFYIYGLLHNITGLTDKLQNVNGEFVIENVSQLDGSKLYLCFLLQSVSATDNPTNDPKNGLLSQFFNNLVTDSNRIFIEKGSSSINKNIQISPYNDQTIPSQTNCITYFDTTKNATVVIYTNPITYNTITNPSDFKAYLSGLTTTTKLFKTQPNSSSDKINNSSNGSNGSNGSTSSTSKTNVENDNIYIDCNPTGESEESIKTYKLPINSNLMNDIQKSSVSTLINNFAMFSILLILCYVGIPQLYSAAVCEKNMSDEDQYYSRIFIFVYFAIVIFALFVQGSVNQDMNQLLAGFFFMFLAVLTYILVLDNGTSDIIFNIKDFVVFIFGILNHLFNPRKITIYIIGFFLAMVLISSFFMKDNDGNVFISSNKGQIAICWISILVLPTVSGLITWTTM
jgi:hypothetical protein